MESVNKRNAKLKRLLYLAEFNYRYVAGNPEKHLLINGSFYVQLKEFVHTFIEIKDLVELFRHANNDELLKRRSALIHVLGLTLYLLHDDVDVKKRTAIVDVALECCKSDEEFFKFIASFTRFNGNIGKSKTKISSAVCRFIKKYFDNKTPKEFAESLGKSNGYHGWKYKDLIKLSHYKTDCIEKNLVLKYALFGTKGFESNVTRKNRYIRKLLEKWVELRTTKDVDKASQLVNILGAKFVHVNPAFIKSQKVWNAIIPHLSTRELLKLLPDLSRYGLLKVNTTILPTVIKEIRSGKKVKQCNLNPLEVLIYKRNYERGGKPLDPKLVAHLKSQENGETKDYVRTKAKPDPGIQKSIEKCLELSYETVKNDLKKRMLITLDLSSKHLESLCFQNRNFTCLEAEMALTLYYMRTESNVTVTYFNNENIEKVTFGNGFTDNLTVLKQKEVEYMSLNSIFKWVTDKKVQIDFFLCFAQTALSLSEIQSRKLSYKDVRDNFRSYRQAMNLPNSKLVLICPGSNNCSYFQDRNILTICGFCPEIPSVIKAFLQGSFE